MDELAQRVLEHLQAPGSSTLGLLAEYHPDDPEQRRLWRENPELRRLWQANPQLYDAFTDRLIAEGHPARALDLAVERRDELMRNLPAGAADPIPEGYRLRFNLVRAANRGGNPALAERLLAPLLAVARRPDAEVEGMTVEERVNVVAQYGRIVKDRADRNPALRAAAAEAYESAAQVPGAGALRDANTYPLVNAALMWRLAAEWPACPPADRPRFAARSAELAREVLARAAPVMEALVAEGYYWLPASAGLAAILAGDAERALAEYERACGLAAERNAIGDMETMRADLIRLFEAGVIDPPDWLDARIGSVVVFSGHRIDPPERVAAGLPPRFPDSDLLIERLDREIRRRLDELNATVGYSSLASGADLLFAQAMLDRPRAELHVVLPFAQEDFVRTSVDYGLPGRSGRGRWRWRFDEVLARVPRECRHYATTEPYLGTVELFEYGNLYTQGLAVLRARQRLVKPKALVVLDTTAEDRAGGARHFRETWEATGNPADVIALDQIRIRIPPAVPWSAPAPPLEELGDELGRSIRAILFADVAGFSRLTERQLPKFLAQYLEVLRGLFAEDAGRAAVFANTWGDGLHVVFGAGGGAEAIGRAVADAAEFALTLLERSATGVRWAELGLGDSAALRVALHVGPVYETQQLFHDRPGFSGQHVNRAARIEPVTLRGCVYCSEQFAAALAVHAAGRFVCNLIGQQELAKNYDRCALYHITRA